MLNFCGKVGWIAAVLVLGLLGCDEKNVSGGAKKPAAEGIQVQRLEGHKALERSRNLRLGKIRDGEAEKKIVEISSVVGRDTLRKGFAITEPVKRMVMLSSAQIGYMLRLGAIDGIVAVGEAKNVADSALYARVSAGRVAEVGNGNALDVEKLMSLKPDYVMTFATGGSQDDYGRLESLGLPVMLTSEWQEDSPLAKMEWIKLYGMMLGGEYEVRADSLYRLEEKRYNSQRGLVMAMQGAGVEDCPKVLAGMSYGGVWYAPGGNSYTARLIKHAGGCYLWASDTTREMRLTLEEVIAAADTADLWINPGMFATPDELKAADPRVADFRPFKEKRVYQNDGVRGPAGGNDYYEGAVARPSELLQNLHACFRYDNCERNDEKSPLGTPKVEIISEDGSEMGLQPYTGPKWYHNIF